MTRSKTGWLFLGSAFVLALAGVTPAVYAHGGDPTLIHACVKNSSGNVKIVGANALCNNNETALDWRPATASPSSGSSIMVGGGSFGAGSSFVFIPAGGVNEYRFPRVGTIQNMRILISSNSFNGPAAVTLFVNGSPTSISTTIPAGSTADIDVPGTFVVLDGEGVSVKLGMSAVSSGVIFLAVSYEIL